MLKKLTQKDSEVNSRYLGAIPSNNSMKIFFLIQYSNTKHGVREIQILPNLEIKSNDLKIKSHLYYDAIIEKYIDEQFLILLYKNEVIICSNKHIKVISIDDIYSNISDKLEILYTNNPKIEIVEDKIYITSNSTLNDTSSGRAVNSPLDKQTVIDINSYEVSISYKEAKSRELVETEERLESDSKEMKNNELIEKYIPKDKYDYTLENYIEKKGAVLLVTFSYPFKKYHYSFFPSKGKPFLKKLLGHEISYCIHNNEFYYIDPKNDLKKYNPAKGKFVNFNIRNQIKNAEYLALKLVDNKDRVLLTDNLANVYAIN